jgi:hypothetical protein
MLQQSLALLIIFQYTEFVAQPDMGHIISIGVFIVPVMK